MQKNRIAFREFKQAARRAYDRDCFQCANLNHKPIFAAH
jgi:hypothetical protein